MLLQLHLLSIESSLKPIEIKVKNVSGCTKNLNEQGKKCLWHSKFTPPAFYSRQNSKHLLLCKVLARAGILGMLHGRNPFAHQQRRRLGMVWQREDGQGI